MCVAYPSAGLCGIDTSHTNPAGLNMSMISFSVICNSHILVCTYITYLFPLEGGQIERSEQIKHLEWQVPNNHSPLPDL
jgi:hypothetical protein